jgi:hypothetical protein
MRRLISLVALLAVGTCGCGKINAGASPQGLVTTTTTVPLPTATVPTTTDAGPVSVPSSAAITADGGLLWNLEALLRATFGNSQPSSADNTDTGPPNPSDPPANSKTGNYVDFNCAGIHCSPLSVYDPYSYTFADPTDSAFHLSTQSYKQWSFGNYPEPVLINGRIVACNSEESTFLIRYADASSFTLACMAPVSR